jgi:glycosyltransferase involved in cell wall biosynthesis
MSDTISEIESLLCSVASVGDLDALAPRIGDAWDLRLPDLTVLPEGREPWRKLRCCIATEDIAGPVRNGGIGTTYAHLAELLVQLGHESTILYLKGAEVETGDLDHWVAFYAEKGVRFVPVPDYAARDGFRSHADRWLRSPYNMMRYLQEHPMDVVHVSEWRGCGYFSLAAKRQGIAFADTLFVVKTSSPWMWNRLYGAEPVEKVDDLAKIHAERRSVELGDVVIGGSLHLLRWMSSQGYQIPRDRAFVQPNVVSFDNLKDLMHKRPVERGSRMAFDEIVFFGRLEGRKGLFVFCQAIQRLVRQGVELPPTITFMGKEGRRLTSRPDLTCLEYIAEASRDWPCEVRILTDYQQYQALEYLLDGPRLAVMPSVIENSSMAIYEAAICGVPCVASDVGGNMELVAEADWPHIFCKPHPLSLGDKLAEAIEIGGYVPRPSFDNAANLDTWRRFHDSLARGLREQLLAICAPGPDLEAELDEPVAEAPVIETPPVEDAELDDASDEVLVEAKAAEPEWPLPDPAPAMTRGEAPRRIEAAPVEPPAAKSGSILRLGRQFAQILKPPPTPNDDAEFVKALLAKAPDIGAKPAADSVSRAALIPQPARQPRRVAKPGAVSVCIYAAGAPGSLKATLESVIGQTRAPVDIVIAVDADRPDQLDDAQILADELELDCLIVEAFDLDAGAALKRAAERAQGSLLLFLWEGATLRHDALAVLAKVAERGAADVLTYMHRAAGRRRRGPTDPAPPLIAQLVMSVSDAFFRQDIAPAPLLVRRAAFDAVGGFTADHRLLGHEAELIAKAQLAGLNCDTVLLELGGAVGPSADWIAHRGYDLPASRFRVIRPALAAAPLVLREQMLMAKGLQAKGGGGGSAAKSKAPRLDVVIEEPFSRMMHAILTEEHSRVGGVRRKSPKGERD